MEKKSRGSEKKYANVIKEKKATFVVFVCLRLFVIAVGVFSFINGAYENLFYCLLTLVLFTLPSFAEKKFDIDLPDVLEIIILFFIFAAEILGELGGYYTRVPYWDSMLHTLNGFLCAAIGFALSDILNRNDKIKFKMSPLFLAITAFCFSMTIGVLWEFFEFFMDVFMDTDMQKDFVVKNVVSTLLGDSTRDPVMIENIRSTVLNGKDIGVHGYLDIGLYDTMKDLFVNFIGAVTFSIIGYFYVKTRGKGKFAKMFIPKLKKIHKTEKKDDKA
ncbi:MAG: hypothetical protein IKW62_05720 [Clostridia bacterium]|nr:hypothetical protein [Clostridia bacterium]